MAVTALGIAPDSTGAGVTPLTHRQCIKARWANTGVVAGLAVSGRSDLSYQVASGVAVCSRGDADGYTEAYWPGGSTPAVAAGGAQPRIDVVWIRANDPTQGDADNHVVVGVTQGSPSTVPAKPSIPSGCTEIAARRMPANGSSTSSSTVEGRVVYAIPFGASLGRLGYAQNTQTVQQAFDDKWYVQCATKVYLPTSRLVEVVWTGRTNTTDSSSGGADTRSSYSLKVQVDGVDRTDGLDEIMVSYVFARNRVSYVMELPAGEHEVTVLARCNTNAAGGARPFWWRGLRDVTVWDRGVSR